MQRTTLTRWSQRKLESIEAKAQRRLQRENAIEPPKPTEAENQTPSPVLPKLEDLTADSNLTDFLRPNIPESLRKAALRKMWLLDPSIRNFVGPARDYDYDWNHTGGVPGAGIVRAEEIPALLRGIFGEPRQVEEAASGTPAEDEKEQSHADFRSS